MIITSEHAQQPRILFVGAFPAPSREVFGGNVTDCKALLSSSLPDRVDLILLDSTQISNPPPALPLRLLLAIKRFFKYLVLFERHRPDAVLMFASAGASFVEKSTMAWYARITGVPALMFPRGGILMDRCNQSTYTMNWVRIAAKGARKFLCQGPAWQRFAVDMIGFNPEDAPIIPSWTATPALLSIGRKRICNSGDRPVQLMFLGWLERNKGIFELIEACKMLSESRNFVLHIAGEGSASFQARELVEKYGLEKIVCFHGWLKGSDLEDMLASADVFVLPSWAEGLPNAMIEAMAAKLAVVVSGVGNIPDVVANGKEALLVPPQDVAALKEALAKVIDGPVLRQQLGEAAFSLAESQWSVEPAVDKLLSAIKSSI